jgi:ABC-type Fe3+-hydroxamate transport system substrate-binding protein
VRRAAEDALAAARERAKGRPRRRTLVVVQREPFMVAGRGAYVHDLLEALGAENAAGDIEAAWPAVSAEALVARAPEAILDASLGPDGATGKGDAAVRAWWAAYPSLPAVREGRARALGNDAALRPGPSVAEAIAALEAGIFPEEAAPR